MQMTDTFLADIWKQSLKSKKVVLGKLCIYQFSIKLQELLIKKIEICIENGQKIRKNHVYI